MEARAPLMGLRGRKDRLWLRLTFCRRAGLLVRRQPARHLRVGFAAYLVEIPCDLLPARRLQIARSIKKRQRLLRLGHVAGRLSQVAGRRDFWGSHTLARLEKPKGR